LCNTSKTDVTVDGSCVTHTFLSDRNGTTSFIFSIHCLDCFHTLINLCFKITSIVVKVRVPEHSLDTVLEVHFGIGQLGACAAATVEDWWTSLVTTFGHRSPKCCPECDQGELVFLGGTNEKHCTRFVFSLAAGEALEERGYSVIREVRVRSASSTLRLLAADVLMKKWSLWHSPHFMSCHDNNNDNPVIFVIGNFFVTCGRGGPLRNEYFSNRACGFGLTGPPRPPLSGQRFQNPRVMRGACPGPAPQAGAEGLLPTRQSDRGATAGPSERLRIAAGPPRGPVGERGGVCRSLGGAGTARDPGAPPWRGAVRTPHHLSDGGFILFHPPRSLEQRFKTVHCGQ
jgi:hypothetical protein